MGLRGLKLRTLSDELLVSFFKQRCLMTTDRADQIIDELAEILEEIRNQPLDKSRLSEISTELAAIETELDIVAAA
jgi:hypothetical protein